MGLYPPTRPSLARLPLTPAKMPQPLNRVQVVKKHKKKIVRIHSDRYKCLSTSWRRPRGIDSRWRCRFHGLQKLNNIGYGSNKKTRHILPNGYKKFLITKMGDLEMLLMHNRTYCGEIAHNVSVRNRAKIVERAAQLDVVLTNGKAASARRRTSKLERWTVAAVRHVLCGAGIPCLRAVA